MKFPFGSLGVSATKSLNRDLKPNTFLINSKRCKKLIYYLCVFEVSARKEIYGCFSFVSKSMHGQMTGI